MSIALIAISLDTDDNSNTMADNKYDQNLSILKKDNGNHTSSVKEYGL